jgi:hypothetical protein
VYNHTRIYSALKMPPAVFAEKIAAQKKGNFFPSTLSKESSP